MGLKNKDLFSKCSPAILRINAYNKDGVSTKHGSAVVLKKKGVIITNYHNIFQSSYFKLFRGTQEVEHDGILIVDKDLDVLLLKIKDPRSFTGIAFKTKYAVGDDILAIGNPLNNSNSFTKGNINGINRFVECIEYPFGIRRKNLIQIDASLSKGNSGGGLFNTNGELIGITTLTDQSGQNLNYVIPIKDILNLLKRVPKVTGHKDKKLEEELLRFHMNLINGDENQALIHIDNCLKIKKDEEYFLFSKVVLLNNLDRGDEAIEVCNKILLNTPKNEEVSFLIFLALFNQLRFNEALQVLEKSFSNQNDYLILCLKGNIYTLLTEYKKAYDCFKKAFVKDDKEIVALLGLAEYYCFTKQFTEAESVANKLYNEHQELLITSYLLGEVYFFTGDHNKSLKFFKEFLNKTELKIKLRFENENINPESYFDSYFLTNAKILRISNLIFLKRIDEAFAEVNNEIEKHPNNTMYFTARAHIYAIKNEFENAIKDLNYAIKINPNNWGGIYFLSMIYFRLEKYKKAFELINKALKIVPNSIDLLTRKAYTLSCLKKNSEAIKISRQIKKLNPSAPESDEILFVIFTDKKNKNELITHTKKLIKARPNDDYYLSLYANALLINKKSNEALKFINKSLQIRESILALIIKSSILFELKRYHDVINLFEKTKREYEIIQPVLEGNLWLIKGKAEMKLRMYSNAKRDIEQAFFIYPPIEKEIRPLLKKLRSMN